MRLIRVLLLLILAVGIGTLALYLSYGTVTPCGMLRQRIKQEVTREGGALGGFVATTLPDKVLDGLIAAQYGPLSPARCIGLLLSHRPPEVQHREPTVR